MAAYVFRYDSGAGSHWERSYGLGSDESARVEGELLLENQAVISPLSGQTISVFRLNSKARELLGTWIWGPDGAQWSAGAPGPVLGEPSTEEQA